MRAGKGGTSLHGKSVERERGRVWDRSTAVKTSDLTQMFQF
jgi:hypothetical protein